MLKKFAKRINLNFKHSNSDRKGAGSYANYNQKLKKTLKRINIFSKLSKNK